MIQLRSPRGRPSQELTSLLDYFPAARQPVFELFREYFAKPPASSGASGEEGERAKRPRTTAEPAWATGLQQLSSQIGQLVLLQDPLWADFVLSVRKALYSSRRLCRRC